MSRTRIKADPLIIGSLERAESALMELAQLTRQQRAIEDDMNAGIDALKEAAKEKTSPLEEKKKALTNALGVYLKMNQTELLQGGRKSVELAFGVIGFRASTALVQMRGVSSEMTLERLKNAGLPEGIRIKEELDKDVMRGWPEERLHLVGLQRQEKNLFFVELKEEKLGEGAV